MGKRQKRGFLLPPAVGYSFGVLMYLFRHFRVSLTYLPRVMLTVLVNIINWPFRTWENIFINRKISKSRVKITPVFIIGHWRSGTTHLHNILCQDPQMAYTTTYQSVFPDTMFNKAGKFLFEGFAKILIPGNRKGDNVKLGTKLPQEEEFALGARTPFSFYYFWMFPRSLMKFYDKFIRIKGLKKSVIEHWKKDYELLILKAMKHTGGQIFLSKNPPNTGRIKTLLEMYPEARFVHIHRNPIEVYLSTHNFFHKMMPHLQLQSVEGEKLDTFIFELYEKLMNDYLEQRDLIPENHLFEISFDSLEKDPVNSIRNLYKKLDLKGFEENEYLFKSYLDKMKGYQKNKHHVTEDLIKRINSRWGFAQMEWGYEMPAHIKIEYEKSS